MTALMKPEADRVDAKTGLIVDVHPTTDEIVTKVKGFLDAKEKKIFFNGKRYAEYEDFQYIGTFYAITVKTFDPHYVEIAGHKGFHAKAMLLRDAVEIGRAEAFCMDDEPNWRSKPLFQLASMAQTRAAAKAYSNIFRPIVKLAGLEGTPAEEMDGPGDALPAKGQKTPEEIQALGERLMPPTPKEIDDADEIISDQAAESIDFAPLNVQAPLPEKKRISEKQTRYLWAMMKNANIPEASFRTYIKKHFGVEHSNALDRNEMDKTLKWIEEFKA